MADAAPPRRVLKLVTLAALIALGVAALGVGTCAVLFGINLGDRKSDHVFLLAGNAPLTDEQASDFARQILVVDRRDLANLMPQEPTNTAATHPGSYGADASRTLSYRHRETGWTWYVQLRREDGRVVGYSYHGL